MLPCNVDRGCFGLLANVSRVALQGCSGCSVTLARDMLWFVNSKKYTDGTGNASVDTRQAEKKGRKINSVKTKKYIDADIFSDIVDPVLAMDLLAQPLST